MYNQLAGKFKASRDRSQEDMDRDLNKILRLQLTTMSQERAKKREGREKF